MVPFQEPVVQNTLGSAGHQEQAGEGGLPEAV